MSRIKIDMPDSFSFTASIPLRITDLNYGGHVGNDQVLSLIHEARVQFLRHMNYTEMNFEGVGMIMTDVAIEYKSELFYGDDLLASVAAGDISRIGFTLFYKLEKKQAEQKAVVALAKTGMVCYNYALKKIVSVPEPARTRLIAL